MIIDFNWFETQEVQNVLNAVMTILGIIRIVVPIALILMTTLDITKNIINPDDKDGQKKIMIRAIAALLVFLSPIIVNLVLNFIGIDTSNLGGINSNFESKDITPTYVKPEDPVELTSLSLFNCPSVMKIGDAVVLETNIPEKYKGGIRWEESKNILDIVPSADKRSAKVTVVSDNLETTTTLTLTAGDMTKSCLITVSGSFSITNCPPLSKRLQPGDRITLTTDVSSKYNGKMLWDQNYNVFKMIPKEDGRSMVLEVVDNPPTTAVTVKAIKGNRESTCLIFVDKPKLDSVSITNCPDHTSSPLSPGDIITLNSDIPLDFKGDIEWIPDGFTNNFIITPSADGRSATLKVIDHPASTFSTTTVLAGGKANSCLINVIKDQNN